MDKDKSEQFNNNESPNPLKEVFKNFEKREAEIINLIKPIIKKDDSFFLNNIFISHSQLNSLESIILHWFKSPLVCSGTGTIDLSFTIESKLLNKFPDFKPKYRLEIGALTDVEVIEKIKADDAHINEVSTIYLFDDEGKGIKLIHVDKNLGLLQYFPNWIEKMKYETENYAYLQSEFNGGDLEIVDYSLFKLKEKIIQEMEKKNNGKI